MAETQQASDGWVAGPARTLPASSVLELVVKYAKRHPTRAALRDEHTTLTYAELIDRALETGSRLLDVVRPGTHVAVVMPRSVDLVATLLGCWAAGVSVLPVDERLPIDRVRFMLSDTGTTVVVGDRHTDLLAGIACSHPDLTIVAPSSAGCTEVQERAHVEPRPDDSAYLIFTSGSTGRPKAVGINHAQLVNAIQGLADTVDLVSDDILLAIATFGFDIAMFELLGPLTRGGLVVVAPASAGGDPNLLAKLIDRENVTVLEATPSSWRLLINSGWTGCTSLRGLSGGEQLTSDLATSLLSRIRSLYNCYGPTETTLYATAERITGLPAHVGKPLQNTEVRVVDSRGRPLVHGKIGEVEVAGLGVATGYINRPELNARSFIEVNGRPVYRTGDLGHWTEDGRLMLHGRHDYQVKIRGYRIELGEIENRLCALPSVSEAVVVADRRGDGDDRLVAYVGGRDHTSGSELMEHLSNVLPSYMMPSAIMVLPQLPKTGTNKIDRTALPKPIYGAIGSPPASPTEQAIADIWKELLGVNEVNQEDDFFALGGHSLLVINVANRVATTMGRHVSVRELFETPTLREIAALIDSKPIDGSS